MSEQKRRKRRAATNAIREIRQQQKGTDFIIPIAPFNRLVQEVAQEYVPGLRFKADAYQALHTASEDHLVTVFSNANAAAIHSKRETVQVRDLKLSMWL